jgi:hypothetical protein
VPTDGAAVVGAGVDGVASAAAGKSLPPAGKVWPAGMPATSSWSSRSKGATVGEPSASRAPGGRARSGGPRPSGAATVSR